VVDAINNTIVENASGSLMGLNGSSGSNINVINNVFWGNTPGVDNNSFNGNLQLYNNVVEGGAASFGTFAGLASSVYDYDPQFVNPATDNYSFDSNSICFDTGIDQTIQGGDLDILGNPRLVNDYCDMGAFERQSCSRDNNLCSGALPLELDADWVYGNTRCSDDGGYPAMTCMGDVSGNVWYSFVAPASGAVDVRVRYVTGFQQLGGIATEVYGGSCGSPIPVGCHNDPLISPFLELTNLIAGATYRIRIEANGMSSLGFEVQVNTEVGPTCLGDFDLNGQVDAGDLLTFLSGFGCTGGCATDLDGDSNTGSSDLLIFLSAFGTLCN
jgi:hypothetical protein